MADQAKSSCLWRIFDTYRTQSSETANKLKASASELLGLSSMLQHFVGTRIPRRDELIVPRASFDAACRVLSVIQLCKRGVASPENGAAELHQALQAHMTLHKRAYGDDNIRPKHHWMFHVGPQLLRDRAIIDTFVVERGHLLVKSIAEHCRNTSCYERAVMSGVVNQLFKNAAVANLESGLRGAISSWQGMPVASHMRILGLQVLNVEIAAWWNPVVMCMHL